MKKFRMIALATIATAMAMFCVVNAVEARGPSMGTSSGAIVRDHRVTPIVRDNRTTPIVGDHRTPPCQGKSCKYPVNANGRTARSPLELRPKRLPIADSFRGGW